MALEDKYLIVTIIAAVALVASFGIGLWG